MPDIVCSVCGKRNAFYYRHSSGERLCTHCLEGSLSNHIKHSFSGRVKLGRSPVLSVYIPSSRVLEGIVLTHLLSKIEVKFNGRVEVIASSNVLSTVHDNVFNNFLKAGSNVNYHELSESNVEGECSTSESIANSVRLLENLKNSNVLQDTQAVLLPYTLTDLNEALMEYVILGSGEAVPPDFSRYSVGGIPIICPFRTVQRADVIALAYVYGVLKVLGNPFIVSNAEACKIYDLIKKLVSEISLRHPELTHTMLKSRKFFPLQPA